MTSSQPKLSSPWGDTKFRPVTVTFGLTTVVPHRVIPISTKDSFGDAA